ncbi:hypothetical protein M3J09_003293 [Ascochyta lentis]
MRRGYDQPTSSSASRSSNTIAREQTQHTRQGRNDAPSQADSISARRKSSNQPNLSLPPQPGDVQSASSGRKSPAYLEGKNPYGQILDDVDHPYRKPKATGGAPSQLGATSSGRLRTSGSFNFKTRPEPKAEPERDFAAPDPSPPQVFPRTPAKPVSVRAARDFFKNKASQHRSAPPFPPPAAATAKGVSAKTQMTEEHACTLPHHHSRDEATLPNTRIAIRSDMDMKPSVTHPPPETSNHLEPSQRTNPFARPKSDSLVPYINAREATTPQDPPAYIDTLPTHSKTGSGGRSSTNAFEAAPRDVRPLGEKQRAVGDNPKASETSSTLLTALEHTNRANDYRISDETVRYRPTHSITAAESDQGAAEEAPPSSHQTQSSQPRRTVRRADEEEYGSTTRRFRRRESLSTPLTHEGTSAARMTRSRSHRSLATNLCESAQQDNETGPRNVLKRVADTASNSFSHDGSGSTPPLSRRSTAPGPIQKVIGHTCSDGPNIAVPDHVDWRGAYGRRRTQDFGYPGARIKPRSTFRTYKPLQEPDRWTKRACGHFSFMGSIESRESASKKLCYHCRTKPPFPGSRSVKQQRIRRRAATDSLSLSSRSSEKDNGTHCRGSRHSRYHSEYPSADKCSDTLAKDLGNIIDAIMEEHSSTLQSVINNISLTQPSLAQLRSVPEDLVQKCEIEGTCTHLFHSRSPRTHQVGRQPCQTIGQPVEKATQQVHE